MINLISVGDEIRWYHQPLIFPKVIERSQSGSSSDDSPLATGQTSLSLKLWMFEVNFGECGSSVNFLSNAISNFFFDRAVLVTDLKNVTNVLLFSVRDGGGSLFKEQQLILTVASPEHCLC